MEFKAADSWLKSRVSVPTDMTSGQLALAPDFPPRVRMHSFFSARVTEANILEGLREQVDLLAAGKINIATARMRLKTFLAGQGIPADDVGMTGKPPPGVDEETWKARKSVTNLASTRRLDLILRQNSAMAHAVGRREVSMQPAVRKRWPYFRYLARMDGRERASHGGFNNLVLPKQHPFWHTHTGPWDFGCRCDVEDADEAEAKQYGKGQVAGTKVVNPGTGKVMEILDNESGFVFDVEEALSGDPDSFDWDSIKNTMLREKVKKAIRKRGSRLPEESVDAIARGIVDSGLAERAELSGLEVPVAQTVRRTLEKLNREFITHRKAIVPGKTPHLSIGTDEKRGNTYAHANTSSGMVNVNPQFFGNSKRLEKQFASDVASGYHPKLRKGVTAAEAITTHEYAHTLTGDLEIKGMRHWVKPHEELRAISRIKSRYTRKTNKLSRQIYDARDEATKKALQAEHDRAYICRYAGKNVDEFMAESFAMVRCGPKNAISPFAQEVYDVILKVRGK